MVRVALPVYRSSAYLKANAYLKGNDHQLGCKVVLSSYAISVFVTSRVYQWDQQNRLHA